MKRSSLLFTVLVGLALPFLSYILLAVLYTGLDPHAIKFPDPDQWYDIPRNENIIMHLSQSWSYFSFLGLAYYKHPPLFFYLSSLGFRWGNQLGLLLLMAAITIGSIIAAYYFIKELYGKKAGFIVALLLAYIPGIFDTSFHVMFDTSAFLFYTLSALILYKNLLEDSWPLTVLAGLICGLMLLLKTALGVIYPGCLLFMFLIHRFGLISGNSYRSKLFKIIVSFFISLLIFVPVLIYQELNQGGYNWLKELFYQLPWQTNAARPPWDFYLTGAIHRWGYLFCGLIIIGLINFLRNLEKLKAKSDIFLFSISLIFCFSLQIWTIKSFRFLLPVFPFLAYLAILGISQIIRLLQKNIDLSEWLQKRIFVFFIAIVVLTFISKDLYVFKGMPGISSYKMAADFIKANGLSSSCYLSDERVIFQNYIQDCTFWGRQNAEYNLVGIIGSDVTIAVIDPVNEKYIPIKRLIKLFKSNNKTAGIYMIDRDKAQQMTKDYSKLDVQIVDQNNKTIKGAFVSLYINDQLTFAGRTNKYGKTSLLFLKKTKALIKIRSWCKMPLNNVIDLNNSNFLKLQMQSSPFLINGVSAGAF